MTMPTIRSESNELERISYKANALSSFRLLNALKLHHGPDFTEANTVALREYQREQGYGVG